MLPISVIIPTYNREEMVGRAIESVLRQSAPCQEIIVVDDGSTDGTAQMIEALTAERAGRKPHLRLIRQENRGTAAAKNRGILAAKADYLAFLDSDDHWKKRKMETQFAALSASPYSISHSKEIWFRRGKHLNQKKIHIPQGGDIFEHCLRLCAVGMSTVMAKRDFFDKIGLFNEKFHCCEDYDLWLRASAVLPFLLIDAPLTIKEGGREDQLSVRYRVGMDKLRIESICSLLDSCIVAGERLALALKELERKITIFAAGCLKHNKEEQGRYYLALFAEYRGKYSEKKEIE